jgi:hypothetical protein
MVLLHELVPSVAEHCRGLVVGKRVQVTNAVGGEWMTGWWCLEPWN